MASENKKAKIAKRQGKCWSFLKSTVKMKRIAFYNSTLRKKLNKIEEDED
jgi:hypothetical protein